MNHQKDVGRAIKVVIIGHFSDNLDEGVRIVAKSIYSNLSENEIHLKKIEMNSILGWIKIINFKPAIIHFVLTPTLGGLIISKILSILNPKSKTIISAIHPSIPFWRVLKLFKPDLFLVQSFESENYFKSLGFHTKILYNGVDIEKFKDVNENTKYELRKKYCLPESKFIILHLASLKRQRNLDVFKKLQNNEENQVLIIGRENEDFDKELRAELEESGCIVCVKHFPKIEEIYNLSDCYVFPTINIKACIETPLSVLEAMACNLPVITTKFGSIPSLFEDKDGLFFINNQKDFMKFIDKIKLGSQIKTRDMVINYSWENISKELREIYECL